MTQQSLLDSLDVFVWEGSAAIAERVSACLSGYDATVIRVDGAEEGDAQIPGDRPAVAVMSVTVVSRGQGRAHEWLAAHPIPVVWVASHVRETVPGFYPPSYTNILPPAFTGEELRTLLFRLAGDARAAVRPRPAAEPLIAESSCMRGLLAEAHAYADCDANVLIYGETGVGKERIARLLHDGNQRYGNGPFVAVNCGAIPDGLFESQFFGHAKGAFTGAVGMHRGYFEQAHGGTLFLDEIGDLPLYQQVKLLRVLEENTVVRLGAVGEVKVDFRLVAATNRDLTALVAEGKFRADLYYRLAVVELAVPSLEERGPVDKIAIFRGLLGAMLPEEVQDPPGWLLERVGAARYQGNVRELRNVVERLAVVRRQFGEWDEARVARVLGRLGGEPPRSLDMLDERDAAERQRVLAALRCNGWRRQETAAHLGISRKVLWEKMRKYRIEAGEDDEPTGAPAVFF